MKRRWLDVGESMMAQFNACKKRIKTDSLNDGNVEVIYNSDTPIRLLLRQWERILMNGNNLSKLNDVFIPLTLHHHQSLNTKTNDSLVVHSIVSRSFLRICKYLFTMHQGSILKNAINSLKYIIQQWLTHISIAHNAIIQLLLDLLENEGGDQEIWIKMRPGTRCMIIRRLLDHCNNVTRNDTYLPVFGVGVFGCSALRILAQSCKMFVSKSQICKCLLDQTKKLSESVRDLIVTGLESWRYISKPEIKLQCFLDAHDLQQIIVLVRDPDQRKQRLDLVTSAGNKIKIYADELEKFHLPGLVGNDNPVPWIHASFLPNRRSSSLNNKSSFVEEWMDRHVVHFYLKEQNRLRTTVVQQYTKLIQEATIQYVFIPKDLIQIVTQFLTFTIFIPP